MKICNNILETIGNTPMVKLNYYSKLFNCTILAKIEYFNPGQSVKDRIGYKMVQDAIKEKKIKPNGTFIESTSGNTGLGIALACINLNYKLICTLSEKQSKEKIDILKAYGVEVVVCPDVPPNNKDSYYSVARKLARKIPNSYYLNQYDNLSNRLAHYKTTGPEIWKQTDGKITKFIVAAGTGGTITGVAMYLKEKNPNVKIIGIDTYGSALKYFHETGEFNIKEVYPYLSEGFGEDIIPENYNFSLIDHFEKVTDKDGALKARELVLKEGIFAGYSAGSVIASLYQLKDTFSKNDVITLLFHDHGSRYVKKIYNDDWLKEKGWY